MNCPQCRKPLTEKMKEHCFHCRARFDAETQQKLRLYFELQDDLVSMQGLQKSNQFLFLSIQKRLQSIGQLLNKDLRAAKPEPAPAQASASKPVLQKKVKRSDASFEMAIGQKWFLIIGIITMVFGIGYFLKYSFDQGWVSPFWRVVSVYFWGIIFLVAGDQFRKKNYSAFGLNLIGGGIAVLYFAAMAAFELYHLVGQVPSFIIMVAITVLSGILAIRYDAKGLACLGALGGFLTPVLLSTGSADYLVLLPYILLLNAGILGISFYKQWGALQMQGFISTYILYTTWFAGNYSLSKFWPALIYLNIYFLIYSIAPLAYSIFQKRNVKFGGFSIMFPNSFLAFGFSWYMMADKFSEEAVSFITLFYAFVFLAFATYLFKKNKAGQGAFVVFIGKAAFFLFLTVPFLFSGHWITLFWLLQAGLLFWLGEKLEKPSLRGWACVLSLLVTFKFFAYDYSEVFRLSLSPLLHFRDHYTSMIFERFITSGMLVGTTFWLLRKARKSVATLFTLLFGGSLFLMLNIETIAFFNDYMPGTAFAAVSVLWGLFSVVMMVLGLWRNNPVLRKISISLFLLTVIKVFFMDMVKVSTPARIISFIAVGMLLIGTSFLYHRFKDKLIKTLGGHSDEDA